MSGVVAPAPVTTAPRERGWGWFLVAVGATLAVTAVPLWPAALALPGALLRLLFPVEPFATLVLVGLAACAVIGWWGGGRSWTAVVALVAAGWSVWQVPLPFDGLGAGVRGWAVVLGAAFALACLTGVARPFLPKALGAVALAAVVAVTGLALRSPSVVDGLARLGRQLAVQQDARLAASLATWQDRASSAAWRAVSRRAPDVVVRGERLAGAIAAINEPRSTGPLRSDSLGPLVLLAPALLAVESMLALALAWAAYHRLSRVRIGPPLGSLRDVRFNDQLIWGLIVGAIALSLPTLADWRVAGANLVVLFGALYVLRGVGVLLWWLPDRLAWAAPLALLVLVAVVGSVAVVAGLLAVALAVGLSDTWRDFRAAAQAGRPVPPR